jgi:hypothetical protein
MSTCSPRRDAQLTIRDRQWLYVTKLTNDLLELHRGRVSTPIVPVNGGMLIHSKFITGMAPAPFGEASEQFVLAQV